jgi:AraC-like DNA-binding protein
MVFHQAANSVENYNYNANLYSNVKWNSHFHKNIELIYLIKGKLSVLVNGCESSMTAEDYALVLSNQIHSIFPNGSAEYWVVVFSEDYMPDFAALTKGKQGRTSVFQCKKEITAFMELCLLKKEPSVFMRKACLYAICSQYLEQIVLVERKIKNDHLIGNILDYIADNYTEPISLKQLANHLGYEYHYLSRLLNQSYKINFTRMLNEYRIHKATELLYESDLSITEISMKSGFQSIRSFNHVFKELMGASPSELRK